MRIGFSFEKPTKNMLRYREDNTTDPIVGTLYVSKRAFPTTPDKLTVTIEET
jgi:hypothetical protein